MAEEDVSLTYYQGCKHYKVIANGKPHWFPADEIPTVKVSCPGCKEKSKEEDKQDKNVRFSSPEPDDISPAAAAAAPRDSPRGRRKESSSMKATPRKSLMKSPPLSPLRDPGKGKSSSPARKQVRQHPWLSKYVAPLSRSRQAHIRRGFRSGRSEVGSRSCCVIL